MYASLLAIKGGGRPKTTFTPCQNVAYSNKVFFLYWVDYALEGSFIFI